MKLWKKLPSRGRAVRRRLGGLALGRLALGVALICGSVGGLRAEPVRVEGAVKPPEVRGVIMQEIEGQGSADPTRTEGGRGGEAGLAEERVIYAMRSALASSIIEITVNAVPGATLQTIRDNFLAGETEASHHDLVILQGGKNNAFNAGGATSAMVTNYRPIIRSVQARADALGIPVFFPEVDPISPEILTQRGFNGTQYQTNILALNTALNGMIATDGITVIPVYAEFKPHYNETAEAWCRNLANGTELDGSHPNPVGTQQFGRVYWEAIAAMASALPDRPISVAIYGDSVMATTYLPAAQRPSAWMIYYASLTGVANWVIYE